MGDHVVARNCNFCGHCISFSLLKFVACKDQPYHFNPSRIGSEKLFVITLQSYGISKEKLNFTNCIMIYLTGLVLII